MKQFNEPDPNNVEEEVLSLASSSPFTTRPCKEVESPVCYSKIYNKIFSLTPTLACQLKQADFLQKISGLSLAMNIYAQRKAGIRTIRASPTSHYFHPMVPYALSLVTRVSLACHTRFAFASARRTKRLRR